MGRRQTTSRTVHCIAVTAGLTACVTAIALLAPDRAAAQDALGSGNALDNNTRVGSGGRNARAARPDYRARNALVTGNAPAGRGFRGSVGYTAPTDFRGTVGSDATYAFRRDSAFSAPTIVQYGRTADNVRFGRDLGRVVFKRDTTPLINPDPLISRQRGFAPSLRDEIRLDRITTEASSRASGTSSRNPTVVGVRRDDEGNDQLVRASSLRGLTSIRVDSPTVTAGLSTLDVLRIREDEQRGFDMPTPGADWETRFRDIQLAPDPAERRERIDEGREAEEPTADDQAMRPTVDSRQETQRAGRTIGPADSDYKEILTRIATRYAGIDADISWSLGSGVMDSLDEDYRELRTYLAGVTEEARLQGQPVDPATMDGTETDEDAEETESPLDNPLLRPTDPRRGTDGTEGEDGETTEDGEEGEEDRPRIPGGAILRHGQRIDNLAGADQTRFDELMRSAEERLRDGEYFWAERRFLRALRFIPGHPLATAGLAHAQLGAGLYGSAALALRSLLTNQPEMIDVQYDPALLPNQVRLLQAIDEMREREDDPRDRGAHGFLMAYVGHQLDDQTLVNEGLDRMETVVPDDKLLRVLRAIWGDPASK